MIRQRSLLNCKRGASALEFGIIAPTLILTLLGIVSAGLVLWGIGGLYTVAALAARCGAVGVAGTPPCTTTTATATFAVTTANTWLFSGIITSANVTPTASVTTCNGVNGKFYQVAISTTKFAYLPAPMNNIAINVSACYPRS